MIVVIFFNFGGVIGRYVEEEVSEKLENWILVVYYKYEVELLNYKYNSGYKNKL